MLPKVGFTVTNECKFGFISNILTGRNFLNFFYSNLKKKKFRRYLSVLIFKFRPYFVGIFKGVT